VEVEADLATSWSAGDYGDADDFWAYQFPKYDPSSGNFSYNNPPLFSLITKARGITNQAGRAKP
jgi:hypothetical protein